MMISPDIVRFVVRVNGEDNDTPLAQTLFIAQLCEKMHWRTEFAVMAWQEYVKFMALIDVAGERLVPSKVVDEVWHLHLTYTQSYWKDFCEQTLGREIHHNPSVRSMEAQQKDRAGFQCTLALYRTHFAEPPAAVWANPDCKEPPEAIEGKEQNENQLGDATSKKNRFNRFNIARWWFPALGSTLLLAACTPEVREFQHWVELGVVVICIGFFGYGFIDEMLENRRNRKNKKKRRRSSGSSDIGGGGD